MPDNNTNKWLAGHPDVYILYNYFNAPKGSHLSAEERERIDRHVEECKECQVVARKAAWDSVSPKEKPSK